jgi:hypothetical protein
MVLKAEPGICVDVDQLDCAGLVFMELFKPAPRPAFRINLHGRKMVKKQFNIFHSL